MKKLLFIGILFVLSSCDNAYNYKPEEQPSKTSIDVLELAKKDSVLYKKVVIDDNFYIVNIKTNLVENKFYIDKTPSASFTIILLIIALVFVLGLKIGVDFK